MGFLGSLSIIIPTYNRENFVKRTLSYWSGKEPVIIVLDGSTKALSDEFLKSLEKNIYYLHFPNLSFQQRLSQLDNLIETKYCMLHADDEIFLLSGLSRCIEEIESNNLICCLGRCLEFEYADKQIITKPWNPLHTSFDGYSLLDDSPIVRIFKHMHPYLCSTVYAVTKTENFLNNISCHVDDKIENLFFEISYELSSAFQGKSKVINELSWLRSNENTPHYTKDKRKGKRTKETYQIIMESDFKTNPVITKIAKHLHDLDNNYSVKLLGEIVFSALKSYAYHANFTIKTANFFKTNNIEESQDKIVLKKLLGWTPPFMNKNDCKNLSNTSKKWREIGVQSNTNEINYIEYFINGFYK